MTIPCPDGPPYRSGVIFRRNQTISINWGTQYDPNGPQGVYGYYTLNSNGTLPRQGFITQGNVTSNVIGLFLQDTWSVSSKYFTTRHPPAAGQPPGGPAHTQPLRRKPARP